MKVCILANSHAHMLKYALDARPRDWSYTIFGAPAAGLSGLKRLPDRRGLYATRPRLNRWLALTSNGQTEILYDAYDGFALVGLGLKAHGALKLFSQYQPVRYHLGGRASFISEAAFKDIVREHLAKTTGYRLMRMLAAQNRPVTVIPSPMPNPNISARRGYGWLSADEVDEAANWVRGTVDEAIQDLARPFGYAIALQPAHTLSERGLTRLEFAKDAGRYGGERYADGDVSHMGGEYGQIVLDQIESAVKDAVRSAAKASPPRALRVVRKRWRQFTQVISDRRFGRASQQ